MPRVFWCFESLTYLTFLQSNYRLNLQCKVAPILKCLWWETVPTSHWSATGSPYVCLLFCWSFNFEISIDSHVHMLWPNHIFLFNFFQLLPNFAKTGYCYFVCNEKGSCRKVRSLKLSDPHFVKHQLGQWSWLRQGIRNIFAY